MTVAALFPVSELIYHSWAGPCDKPEPCIWKHISFKDPLKNERAKSNIALLLFCVERCARVRWSSTAAWCIKKGGWSRRHSSIIILSCKYIFIYIYVDILRFFFTLFVVFPPRFGWWYLKSFWVQLPSTQVEHAHSHHFSCVLLLPFIPLLLGLP